MTLNGGFANYPTYALTLWLDNEPALYDDILLLARQAKDLYEFQIALKDYIYDLIPIPMDNPILADLLEYAIQEIDFYELAKYYTELDYEAD